MGIRCSLKLAQSIYRAQQKWVQVLSVLQCKFPKCAVDEHSFAVCLTVPCSLKHCARLAQLKRPQFSCPTFQTSCTGPWKLSEISSKLFLFGLLGNFSQCERLLVIDFYWCIIAENNSGTKTLTIFFVSISKRLPFHSHEKSCYANLYQGKCLYRVTGYILPPDLASLF